MRQTERVGRPSRRRLTLVAGVVTTSLVVVIATASTLGRVGPNITALSPEAHDVAKLVASQLGAGCLNKEQATALISSALADAGATSSFTVRTDGPLAHPIGEGDVVRQHIAKGCYVYSGTGLDGAGYRVFYSSGPDAIAEETPEAQ